MTMKDYIRTWLGIADDVKGITRDMEAMGVRINNLETIVAELNTLEKNTQMHLNDFGDYKNRTDRELNLMGDVIDNLIESLESLTKRESTNDIIQQRAKLLLKRLKNNKSRIQKAKAA